MLSEFVLTPVGTEKLVLAEVHFSQTGRRDGSASSAHPSKCTRNGTHIFHQVRTLTARDFSLSGSFERAENQCIKIYIHHYTGNTASNLGA